jgi:hypothetical protein
LVLKENVSRSFSIFAILCIIMTYVFFISLDAMRLVLKIEPEGLSEERQLIRRKKLIKKIMADLKDKKKRRRYRKLIKQGKLAGLADDPFIVKLEKTFHISYHADLRYIDEESILECANLSQVGSSGFTTQQLRNMNPQQRANLIVRAQKTRSYLTPSVV